MMSRAARNSDRIPRALEPGESADLMPAEQPAPVNSALYNAIVERRSCRRFADQEVPEPVRRQIAELAIRLRPLVSANRFVYSSIPIVGRSQELAAIMGGYGRLVSARHLLLPRIEGVEHLTLDFGFRTEQLVIHLTRLGLASCYIAALGHEREALARFQAPSSARIPAVVIFGYPATSRAGRGFNRAIRASIGADRRLPYSKFCFAHEFGTVAGLSPLQELVMDALRHAPSAGNSRPWRVVIRGGLAYLSVKLDTPYYLMSKGVRLGYHLLDAGIGMANVSLALMALGQDPAWALVGDEDLGRKLRIPDNHQLIAAAALPES